MVWPTLESRTAKEQNSTQLLTSGLSAGVLLFTGNRNVFIEGHPDDRRSHQETLQTYLSMQLTVQRVTLSQHHHNDTVMF